MKARVRTAEFFRAGGTLLPNARSYVTRPADDELFKQVLAGQFCYVLTSRQRGKSSMMVRTVNRLCEAGMACAIVDLSAIGAQASREQWYLGVLKKINNGLKTKVDVERWWIERQAIGPVQRFADFLHDVALAKLETPIAIFVDEIDTTLKLDFTDDFFAAIRAMYNQRARRPEYERLTFVLLGVAAPADLIKDRQRTPFNIGHAIELQELSRADARPLQEGLDLLVPGQGGQILDRIFVWTNGHPYLTQRLCAEIVEQTGEWDDARVDALVERLFFAEDARNEDNLQFVRRSVLSSPLRRPMLRLYRRIYGGGEVVADERSTTQQRLLLSGLVQIVGGRLKIRNAIYQRVFNMAWIKANTPVNWTMIISIVAVLLAAVAVATAILLTRQQEARQVQEQVDFAKKEFLDKDGADVKVSNLDVICGLDRADEAQALFFRQQTAEQQRVLFERVDAPAVGESLIRVVRCLQPGIAAVGNRSEQDRALVKAMSCALEGTGRPEVQSIRDELDYLGPCPSRHVP
jgi:hypothetical protein